MTPEFHSVLEWNYFTAEWENIAEQPFYQDSTERWNADHFSRFLPSVEPFYSDPTDQGGCRGFLPIQGERVGSIWPASSAP